MLTRRLVLGSIAATFAAPRLSLANDMRVVTARRGRRQVLAPPAPESDVAMLDGAPAPMFRIKLGDPLRFRLVNGLDEPLALHWRGMRARNAMDGTSLTQKPIASGASFDVDFTPPDAGVYLYHPSERTVAAAQMARGLAGLVVVEERAPPIVDLDLAVLLSDWTGVDERPVAIADQSAAPQSLELAPGARVRLRIGNASVRRMMAAGVDGARAMVGAVDGQPCTLFEPVRQTLPVAPGARYELFFDLPREPNAEARLVVRGMSGAPDLDQTVVTFRAGGAARPALPELERLPDNPLLPGRIALEKARRAELLIEGAPGREWRVNGQNASAPAAKPLFSVKRGTPVSLGFVNKSATAQLLHVHGHALRNVHLFDDGWDPYWRDSVIVPEGRTVRTAFVADNPGKWLISAGFGVADGPVSWFEVSA